MSATSQTNNPPVLIHPHLVPANVEPQVNLPVEPAPRVDLQPPPTVADNSQNIRCIFPGCSSSFTTIQCLVTHLNRVQGRHAPHFVPTNPLLWDFLNEHTRWPCYTCSKVFVRTTHTCTSCPQARIELPPRPPELRPAEIIDDISEPCLMQCL